MKTQTADKSQEILIAAAGLFSIKGFENTTVDEIAAQANVGKGTIYLYFKNKEHILVEILEDSLNQIYEIFEGATTSPGNFLDQLQQVFYNSFIFFEANRNLFQIFHKASLKFSMNEKQRLSFKEKQNNFSIVLTEFFKRGIHEGFLRPEVPKYFTCAFSGILSQFAYEWLISEEQETQVTPEVISKIALQIFLTGAQNKSTI